jgi:hypothetical protein
MVKGNEMTSVDIGIGTADVECHTNITLIVFAPLRRGMRKRDWRRKRGNQRERKG